MEKWSINHIKRYQLSLIILIPLSGNAALSATTANIIQGNKPLLVLDNGATIINSVDELLTITLSDGVTQYLPSNAPTPIAKALASEMLSQYTTRITADNSVYTFIEDNFSDTDGDQFDSIKGHYQAYWQNKQGQIITDLSTKFDACDAPYYLTIVAGTTANPITVNSKYGYPANNEYGFSAVSYQVAVKDAKICYLKPTNMTVEATGTTLFGSYPYGGFNSAVFDKYSGFIPSKTTFPSTAFPQASFQLMMSGEQANYRYLVEINGTVVSDSANPGSYSKEIEVDSNGKVIFNKKPIKGSWPATVKFIAKLKTDASVSDATYSTKINTWFVSSQYMDPNRKKEGYNSAIAYCTSKGGVLPKRSQLSNSPYANESYFAPNSSQPPTGSSETNWWGVQYFQRDSNPSKPFSQSLTSEWGDVTQYSGAGLGTGYYTSEYYNADKSTVYGVNTYEGSVSRYHLYGEFDALCVL